MEMSSSAAILWTLLLAAIFVTCLGEMTSSALGSTPSEDGEVEVPTEEEGEGGGGGEEEEEEVVNYVTPLSFTTIPQGIFTTPVTVKTSEVIVIKTSGVEHTTKPPKQTVITFLPTGVPLSTTNTRFDFPSTPTTTTEKSITNTSTYSTTDKSVTNTSTTDGFVYSGSSTRHIPVSDLWRTLVSLLGIIILQRVIVARVAI